ncbi:MAG TPA: dihydrofolate reductase family protein [Thermomicrobiales bacterium]|nr:dihydrofolate reductase family protein [Thermomicrobiales bacterium]
MKLALTEFVSVDGVMEDPHLWHFPFFNEEGGQYKFDELRASEALLLGRVTYEGFAAAWPERSEPGHEEEKPFADLMNGIPKYVVSTTLENPAWNNSHVIRDNVEEEIQKLRRKSGRDLVIHGSCDLANWLMQRNLIDEYRLMVHPIVVGKGKRIFQEGTSIPALTLVESRPLATGIVILTYHPAEPRQA